MRICTTRGSRLVPTLEKPKLNGSIRSLPGKLKRWRLKMLKASPAVIGNARVLPFLSENISLLKKTRLTEGTTLELGAEAFNIFNRHRFNFPGSDLIDPFNFGFS